jgi:hypothetical protein
MATDQLPGQVVSHARTAFHDRVSTRIGEFNQENRRRAAALKAMLTDCEAEYKCLWPSAFAAALLISQRGSACGSAQ